MRDQWLWYHSSSTASKEIYSKWSFKLLTNYHIKIIERTVSVTLTAENLQLVTPKDLEPIKNIGKFHYLHIGLVQVSTRTLTRSGLNTSILIWLRDCRHHKFSNSLLWLIKSSLNEGLVFFHAFPKFSVTLTDPGLLKVLTLNLQTQGFSMDPAT